MTAKVRCNSDTSGLPWGAQRRWKRQNSCRGCHSRRDIRHIPCLWSLPGAVWVLVSCLQCSTPAMEAAVAAHCGVLEIGPSMAGQEAMPWSLKEAFSSGQSAVAIAGCLITNSTQFLNHQSHLHIHTSFIPGAGQFPDCLTRLYNTRASFLVQVGD